MKARNNFKSFAEYRAYLIVYFAAKKDGYSPVTIANNVDMLLKTAGIMDTRQMEQTAPASDFQIKDEKGNRAHMVEQKLFDDSTIAVKRCPETDKPCTEKCDMLHCKLRIIPE